MSENLLEVKELVKDYTVGRGRRKEVHRAVDHVSFDVAEGEVLGLVGESGSGKSTTARCLLRLIEPTSGEVRFAGTDVLKDGGHAAKKLRSQMQMVFQDPYSSLDPRMRVEDIIAEGMIIHGTYKSKTERRDRVVELLDLVGLQAEQLRRRPVQFSGGERQRIGIARALALNPRLLVCDEPVASLDVSIQAQILNLFKKLQQELSLTILYIAHDLATVRFLCDRVAVMHNGVIQEIGDLKQIYEAPESVYTRELLAAVPVPDPRVERRKYAERRALLDTAAEHTEDKPRNQTDVTNPTTMTGSH